MLQKTFSKKATKLWNFWWFMGAGKRNFMGYYGFGRNHNLTLPVSYSPPVMRPQIFISCHENTTKKNLWGKFMPLGKIHWGRTPFGNIFFFQDNAYTLRKPYFYFLSQWMGYDRGDSFPFQFSFRPNGIPFSSKSKGKLAPRSYPIQFERK